MTIRVAEAEATEPTETDTLVRETRSFLRVKNTADMLKKEADQIRDRLAEIVMSTGEADENGSVWLDLPDEIEGIVALKRERRVSQSLDADEAERILESKGLAARCYKTIPVLDEDEVMAALYEGLLTEADIDTMFPKKVSWAFVPSKKR
jgi:hypothetical protein